MEQLDYISIGIGVLGFISGCINWAINIKIKSVVTENTAKMQREIQTTKDKLTIDIGGVNDNFIRELAVFKDKATERLEEHERELTELKSNFSDRILSTVNGKYVRSERLSDFKQLIEVSMEKLEQSINRQIEDLKDRLFHDK